MRLGVALAAVLLAATQVCVGGAHAECPPGRDLPAGTLAEARLPAGALLALNQAIDKGGYEVRALLVLRDCKVVFERYRHDLDRDNIQVTYSVTKSVVVTLAGALMLQGRLASLDVPLASLIEKPASSSAEDWHKAEQITLGQAFGMASGLDAKHNPFGGDVIYYKSTDRVYEALKSPLGWSPGTRFNYSDRDASLFGAAVEGAGKAGLLDIARETLFGPLEFGHQEWPYRDRAGRYPGGWALRLRPIDMAKLGQLYLQNGVWNGRPIVPVGHVGTVWTPGPAPYYGRGWWIATEPTFASVPMRYANGARGQRVFIFPQHGTVVVLVSSLGGQEQPEVATLVSRTIAEALAGDYAADPEGERLLAELKASGFHGITRVGQSEQDLPGR